MTAKKHKFDLTSLVHKDYLKDGETLYFVSDPSKTCRVMKQPNGEYKVKVEENKVVSVMTIHAFAQACLQTEPPDHASRWVRTSTGKTLYELWHAEDDAYSEAA